MKNVSTVKKAAKESRINLNANCLKTYEIFIKLSGFIPPDKRTGFILRFYDEGPSWYKLITAADREEVVNKIGKYVIDKKSDNRHNLNHPFQNLLGDVCESVVVSDDYNEVFWTNLFKPCASRNRFLPKDKVDQLVKESKGLLQPRARARKSGQRTGSVEWVAKRRRGPKSCKTFAKYVYRNDFGGYYYAYFDHVPQRKSKSRFKYKKVPANLDSDKWMLKKGKLFQKRKKKTFRLKATTIDGAMQEAARLRKKYL